MRQPPRCPALLLAGTSEAGKSSAGEYLAALGVRRIKIRTLLSQLKSGWKAYHEGVETREGFDYDEFISALLELSDDCEQPLAVESFIDCALAMAVKRAWPASCAIVFITAPRRVRITRLTEAKRLSTGEARRIIHRKDERKRVRQQLSTWRAIADHWIDNSTDILAFRACLRDALEDIQAVPGGAQP